MPEPVSIGGFVTAAVLIMFGIVVIVTGAVGHTGRQSIPIPVGRPCSRRDPSTCRRTIGGYACSRLRTARRAPSVRLGAQLRRQVRPASLRSCSAEALGR